MEIIQDLRPAEEVVWDFYGTRLKAMRRIQLWRLCDIHKIEYPRGCTKDIALARLENMETELQASGRTILSPPPGMDEATFWKIINGPSKHYNEYTGGMTTGQTNVAAMREALEGKPEVAQPEPEVSHFETIKPAEQPSQSWAELRAEAKARGIKVHGKRRPQIEAELNG